MKNRIIKILWVIVPLVLLLFAWHLYVNVNPKSAFYLGTPKDSWREFINGIRNGTLLNDMWVTFKEVIIAFILGTVLGTITGLLLWRFKVAYLITKPVLFIWGAVPVFALGPILIFWFGTGILSKIVIGFLSTYVVSILQTYNGATQTDKNLLDMMAAFNASKWQITKHIVIPNSLIWVLSGVRLSISMALMGAFIGEFIASNAGLGHFIIVSESLFNVSAIWAGILGLVIISLILHLISMPLERLAQKWNS